MEDNTLNMKKFILKFVLTVTMTFGVSVAMDTVTHNETANAASYSTVYKVAQQQLGKPYGWGAVGPYSFDCSGFTSYVYKKGASKKLPRTAQSQYNKYKHVSYSNLEKGDLVFFGGNVVNIRHVGMYIGRGKMIDSQNRGVITEGVKAPWWNFVGAAHVTNLG